MKLEVRDKHWGPDIYPCIIGIHSFNSHILSPFQDLQRHLLSTIHHLKLLQAPPPTLPRKEVEGERERGKVEQMLPQSMKAVTINQVSLHKIFS